MALNIMNIKKQLLTKIHQLPGNPSYMDIVDLIIEELEDQEKIHKFKLGISQLTVRRLRLSEQELLSISHEYGDRKDFIKAICQLQEENNG